MRPTIDFRVLLILGAVLLAAGSALAQDQPRCGTGRHRPDEPAVQEEIPSEETETGGAQAGRGNWFLQFGLGLGGGSDLFRAETVNGFPVGWPGSPYRTPGVYTKLGNGPVLGLGLGRRLGSWVNLRADFSWSDLDVIAESAVGQVGGTYTYDQFSIWEIFLGAEFRLVRNPSAPYVGAGLALVGISPVREDELAQSNLGGRLLLGYEQVLRETLSLRLEGRLTYGGFSVGDYEPVTNPPTEIVVEGEDALTVWQLMVGVQLEL